MAERAEAVEWPGKPLSQPGQSPVAGGELAISWGGNVDAVIDYEGRFNGDRSSNALIGRLNFRL